VKRTFSTFLGIDLGGGRGKTTAVAELRMVEGRSDAVEVVEVATRDDGRPWTDASLFDRLSRPTVGHAVIAIDAPLTQPSCTRCPRPRCPGVEACEEPAVIWLRTTGRALVRGVAAETGSGRTTHASPTSHQAGQARLAPYAHRATDVVMTYERGLLPSSSLGAATGAIAARAGQLRRRLHALGKVLHEDLIEVSPAATVAALFGPRLARGYKRDADPWRTRAVILERLGDLGFSARSRMAREDVLRNDHCFDAVISAYTAFLWARDGREPPAALADDGWIFAP
jgi:predicted RNase H-like nuclease